MLNNYKFVSRHLQKFWGASGDFWQRNWEYIYDKYDGDQYSLAFVGEKLFIIKHSNKRK